MSLRDEPSSERPGSFAELPGADVIESGNALIFSVNDRERWKRDALPILETVFGETIFDEYDSDMRPFNPQNAEHRERVRWSTEFCFEKADQVLVLKHKNVPAGFRSLFFYPDVDKTCGVGMELCVKREYRSLKLGKELLQLALHDPKMQSMLGYTQNPFAVSAWMSASKASGFKGYYGLTGNSIHSVAGLKKRRAELLKAEGIMADDEGLPELPLGFVFVRSNKLTPPQSNIPLPSESNELYKSLVLQNDLQQAEFDRVERWNATRPLHAEKKFPATVAGILVAVRERKPSPQMP